MKDKIYLLLLQKKSARIEFGEKHIAWFARYYFSHHIRTPIGELHREWITIMQSYDKVALACPREHAKSTWWSLIYVIYCILYDKKKFILLVSDTASQAESLLGSIVEELETNEKLIRDFGKLAGYVPPKSEEKEKWTAKEIVTTSKIKVVARGWKSKLRGLKKGAIRPDLIILDDVENDENVESEDQRSKVKNVFNKSIQNLGSQGTQIIVIGTILHFDSLLNELIANPRLGWYTKLFRALENGVPIWSEWWSIERLEKKKSDIGTIPFEQEFMNNPLDPSTQILKPTAYYHDATDLTFYDCFGYIDLAISEKETSDYTAIVTIGRHRTTGKLRVIDATRIRAGVLEVLDLVFNLHSRFRYVAFGVEAVAFQKAFYQMLVAESSKQNKYIPAIAVEVHKDKVTRALGVSPYIENGMVEFNPSNQDFMAEIIQFPKASHDDFVDALVGSITLAIQNGTDSGKIIVGNTFVYPK